MEKLEKKILKVLEAVERVPKKGYNSFNKYNYVMEADLLDYIRPLMVKYGIIFGFDVEEIKTEPCGKGIIAYAKCRFSLVNSENPTERVESVVWGSGYDTQDKGLYKAYTGATKYFLMKSNLISTGDDPEKDYAEELRASFREAKPKKKKDDMIRDLPKEEQEKILQKIMDKIKDKTKEEKEKIKSEILIANYGVDKIEELTVSQARKFWNELLEVN